MPCSSKTLQALSHQLDRVRATEKSLTIPFISALCLFMGGESELTSAGFFPLQERWKITVTLVLYSLLYVVVSS